MSERDRRNYHKMQGSPGRCQAVSRYGVRCCQYAYHDRGGLQVCTVHRNLFDEFVDPFDAEHRLRTGMRPS